MPIIFPSVVNADGLTTGTMPIERVPTQWLASDTARHSNDAQKAKSEGAYTKIKEILINFPMKGTKRIKFDLRSDYGTAYGKIYINGVAVGTERSAESTYQTFSEDFATDFKVGDLIQIYGYNPGAGSGYGAYIRNFRICGDPTTYAGIHINQDP